MKKLEIKNLKKIYGNKDTVVHALNGISFDVYDGEFIAIMGTSGCGKSTLLNCIAAIDDISSGCIICNRNSISDLSEKERSNFRKKQLGFIFQDYNLLDTLNAKENILLPIVINGGKEKQSKEHLDMLLSKLGIADIINRYPYQLSGGQQQRVAIARALISNPQIILADEPTGALDSKSSKLILDAMQQMNQELSATILMVTHDAFAASFANRVIFLKDGKVFNMLSKGEMLNQSFYNEIIGVISLMGGE